MVYSQKWFLWLLWASITRTLVWNAASVHNSLFNRNKENVRTHVQYYCISVRQSIFVRFTYSTYTRVGCQYIHNANVLGMTIHLGNATDEFVVRGVLNMHVLLGVWERNGNMLLYPWACFSNYPVNAATYSDTLSESLCGCENKAIYVHTLFCRYIRIEKYSVGKFVNPSEILDWSFIY